MLFSIRAARTLCCLLLCFIAEASQAADASSPTNIAARRELFVDDFLNDSLNNVRLELQYPQPQEVVFACDQPWEGNTSIDFRAIEDGGRFRMWYQGVQSLFVLHFVVTCGMGGIMWFVQICYYPNLAVVGREAFIDYQRAHIRRITRVAWTMLVLELITAIALACVPHHGPIWAGLIVNLVLLLGIWWSTFFVQVPLHHRLEQGWDEAAHLRLIQTNWFRTAVYTLRVALVVAVLWTALQPV